MQPYDLVPGFSERDAISVVHLREDAGMVDHTHQVLNSLAELLSSLTSAESGQRGFVITGQDGFLQP